MRSSILALESGIRAGSPAGLRKAIIVLLVMGSPLVAAETSRREKAAAAPAASAETVELVELFLKAPTSALPPEKVPEFLAVDPGGLPAKLRSPYEAKRQELLALKKIAEGKKKPPVRRLDAPPASCAPTRGDARLLQTLKGFSGFDELTEDELEFLLEKTKCSECEMQEESSLMIFLLEKGPKAKLERHPLLHGNDPFMTLVAKYRDGRRGGIRGTEFFSVGLGGVCH